MKPVPRRPVSNSLPAWRKLLQARPVRNHAAIREDQGAGRLRLTVDRQPSALLKPPFSWILRVSRQKSHVLDALGQQIWELCDGRHDVEQIIDHFSTRHGLTFHEGRVTVTTYLRNLLERGLIAVAFPPEEPTASATTLSS